MLIVRWGLVMSTTSATSTPAPIQPGTLYPLQLFKQLTGLGNHAMRTARRQGLKVRYLAGRAFVHSDDFFEYLRRLDEQTEPRD